MTEKRKRRWFQFSLRTLLVFVLLVSIGMSWLGVKLERARRQREAVEAIERAGGRVFYSYQVKYPAPEPPVPKWAHAILGDDFFFDVVRVRIVRGSFGEDEARHLEVLTSLTLLDLGGTPVTDVGLEHLEGLTSLQSLNLTGTQVSDAGLQHLEGLTALGCLYLGGAQVTDVGLEHLNGLSNLRLLFLDNTPFTNAGLEHLEGLTNLTGLDLGRTQVTDAGLEHLIGLANLTYLNLIGTQVTPEGVAKLQEALPECEIVY